MLKAWFDRGRYQREIAALQHWEAVNGPVVLAQDDSNAVACLSLIGGTPGGGPRPADGDRSVASALARLHIHSPPDDGFSSLDEYLVGEVESRIRRRVHQFADRVPRQQVALGFGALQSRLATATTVLLHGDLYRENVPFAKDGPVFLDPLPMLGDRAFDWAFFIVYHDLAGDPVARLRLASDVGAIPVNVLIPWCLTLCFDGLLYYHEVKDAREQRMADVMEALAAVDGLPS
jgi:streptomycin 6-kinase